MSTFIERLEVEKKELQEKTESLYVFLQGETFKSLTQANRILLQKQYQCMTEYLEILIVRIDLNK